MASNLESRGYGLPGYGEGKSHDEYNEEEALSRALEALMEGLTAGEMRWLSSGMQPKPTAHENIDSFINQNDSTNINQDFYDMFKKDTGIGLDELMGNINLSESIRNPMPLLKEDPYPVQNQQPTLFERLTPTLEETGGRGSRLPEAFGNKLLELIFGTKTPISGKDEKGLQDSISQHNNNLFKK